MRPWMVVLVSCCVGLACMAQDFEITAIERDGTIRWQTLDGRAYTVESRDALESGSWETAEPVEQWPIDVPEWRVNGGAGWPAVRQRLYRVVAETGSEPPEDLLLIPGGTFTMGDWLGEGDSWELPQHQAAVSSFYIGKMEVSKAKWDEVHDWAVSNGYDFETTARGKTPEHPVSYVEWYGAVKWCNARSEMEGLTPCYYTDTSKTVESTYRSGRVDVRNDWVRWDANGYRLPTETEWEYAARGGAPGHRFPWSDVDTISHSRANYQAAGIDPGYDESFPAGYHPDYYDTGSAVYTSPVGSFAPSGYGLYDLAGNLWEWCWDGFGFYEQVQPPPVDPHGPDFATYGYRIFRGGSWNYYADSCRVAKRRFNVPSGEDHIIGFRVARNAP